MSSPIKPHAPSCERNRDHILAVLRDYLPGRKKVLEIGSGTGQHAVHFAAALPDLIWQTSDLPENLEGIEMWLVEAGLPNTPAPLLFDVQQPSVPGTFDAVFSANTLHIMSWSAVEGLFAGLPTIMARDAPLIVYGPFNYGGRFTSDSNARFNEWLQERAPHRAIRDFEAVDALAREAGLSLLEDRPLPANNRALVWRFDKPSQEF
ncbi:MAG: DUF938 domain-containing protein [Methylococcaceae bacterium]|nr:DUF938 domain-containing protein [Methylococcaceae bacterium]